MSFGDASSSAKIESALSEPSRLGGAVVRRVMVGFGASDLEPKKKFLMDERAEGFDWSGFSFSLLLLLLLLPSSWARRGTE